MIRKFKKKKKRKEEKRSNLRGGAKVKTSEEA
jgi:hypothetical protein